MSRMFIHTIQNIYLCYKLYVSWFMLRITGTFSVKRLGVPDVNHSHIDSDNYKAHVILRRKGTTSVKLVLLEHTPFLLDL